MINYVKMVKINKSWGFKMSYLAHSMSFLGPVGLYSVALLTYSYQIFNATPAVWTTGRGRFDILVCLTALADADHCFLESENILGYSLLLNIFINLANSWSVYLIFALKGIIICFAFVVVTQDFRLFILLILVYILKAVVDLLLYFAQ